MFLAASFTFCHLFFFMGLFFSQCIHSSKEGTWQIFVIPGPNIVLGISYTVRKCLLNVKDGFAFKSETSGNLKRLDPDQ